MPQLEVRIQGVPAIVEVTSVVRATPAGARGYLDPPEPAEVEFTVLDRRGRPAPWLAKKMSQADVERIADAALET